ncbi:MAG TPA: cation:proton antiporter, partial [Candidatus Eisenbacteria bacterium]
MAGVPVMSLISELGPILFLAAVLGLLAARLGQPPLLGYIAAGIVAGSGAFGLIWHEETIRAFGDLGIVLLLFYLGLELSWHRMKPIAGRSVLLALTITGVPFLVLVNILLLAGMRGITPAVIAFILSINSTAIAVQALEARGLFSGRLAGLVIGSNLVVDILAIIALTALGVGHGASDHNGGQSLGEVLLRTAGFVAACATVGLAVVPRALDAIHAHRASRLLMPVALIATGLMVAFAGERLGVPLSVGAFVAGILAAESKAREELVACLDPIKELFLGVFFVAVGFEVTLG